MSGDTLLAFTNSHGTYNAIDKLNRVWRISPTLTGWRLEFRDAGDPGWTYASTHDTLRAAQKAADE
jgi:hypothetical protein